MKRPVFFYGLFMDAALLEAKGVEPGPLKSASVSGWSLRIGARATLVPAEFGIVHGMLGHLSHSELALLYSEPSLADYQPCAILALTGGHTVEAVCYTLASPPSSAERNPEYAGRLRALAERLRFPAEYVASIQ